MEHTGRVTYEEKQGRIYIFPQGDLNISNIREMDAVFNEILGKRPSLMAINCSGLQGIDSTAIATMVKTLRRAKEIDARLVFYDLPPVIRQTFEIMTLHKFFTILTREQFEEQYGG